MQAWQATGYGGPAERLCLSSMPMPIPGPGEVRIAIAASSLNPIDFKLLRGDLRRVQETRFPMVPGFDACGVIDACGEGVVRFKPGDRVYVRGSRDTQGAFAQYCVQPASFVSRAPAGLEDAEAASLPLVALTTIQGLVDRAQARAGQTILVQAGSGGLGSFAIQYARHLGLHVHATTSSRNVDWVAALGAERVFAYDREDYRQSGLSYDIVFDTLGGQATLDAFSVIAPGGCVVSVAGPPDHDMAALVGGSWIARSVMRFMARGVYAAAKRHDARYFRFLTESSGEQLEALAAIVDAGHIKPVIERVFPFTQLVAAYELLIAGRARGKIVLAGHSAVDETGG